MWYFASLGLLAGIGAPIMATLLMIFKTGIHAHGFSEYGMGQFLLVLSAFPISLFLGVVFGLLLSLGANNLE